MSLKVGDKAPDFTLTADNGKPYQLSKNIKDKVLLVFYPGDGTPVCTAQLCEYRDGLDEFKSLGVDVVGISANDSKSHKKFKKDQNLPFTLLTDEGGKVAEEFGAKGWFGIKRAVYLVDKNMNVKYAHVEPVSVFRRSLSELTDAIKRCA